MLKIKLECLAIKNVNFKKILEENETTIDN